MRQSARLSIYRKHGQDYREFAKSSMAGSSINFYDCTLFPVYHYYARIPMLRIYSRSAIMYFYLWRTAFGPTWLNYLLRNFAVVQEKPEVNLKDEDVTVDNTDGTRSCFCDPFRYTYFFGNICKYYSTITLNSYFHYRSSFRLQSLGLDQVCCSGYRMCCRMCWYWWCSLYRMPWTFIWPVQRLHWTSG